MRINASGNQLYLQYIAPGTYSDTKSVLPISERHQRIH